MIHRKGMNCCCNDWKQQVKELWEKFQTVITGIKMNGHEFYPDGQGVINLQYWYQSGTTEVTEWDADTLQATVTIAGLKADDHIVIGPDSASWSAWGNCQIRGVAQGDGTVTLQAATIPEDDVTMQWVIL